MQYLWPETLVIDADGIRLDFSAVEQHFQDEIAQDPVNGLADLIAFNRGSKGLQALMAHYMASLPNTAEMLAMYAETGIHVVGQANFIGNGSANDDVILAADMGGTIYGNGGNDTIVGRSGSDTLYGNDGADTLNGGAGNDTLDGGAGNDTYIFATGSGVDRISDYDATAGNTDTVSFGNVASTALTSLERKGNDLVVKYGTSDQLTVSDYFNASYPGYKIEQFKFSDGVTWNEAAIKSRVITNGDATANSITGYNDGTNRIYGLDGNDYLYGGALDDTIDGGIGDDMLDGSAGNDYLQGKDGNDVLYGQAGNDIMQGGAGIDTLSDTVGNNLLDGGADNDTITGGAGNEFFAGGAGNDVITTGAGADVIAFNRGDGQDVVNASTGKDNTLSLGKGIKYADLLFSKTGNDLTLMTGASEQVTFKDWYASVNNHSVANLQVVIEGTTDYDAASASVINNKKVEQFNFDGLVTAFDQARAVTPTLTSWALSSSLLNFYLNSSDTAAIGGDLTYQYAKNGNLSTISMTPAQALLASAQFGTANQGLQATSALQDASPRLM